MRETVGFEEGVGFRYPERDRIAVLRAARLDDEAKRRAMIVELEAAATSARFLRDLLARHETRSQAVARVRRVMSAVGELREAVKDLGYVSAAALFLPPGVFPQAGPLLDTAEPRTSPPGGWKLPAPGSAASAAGPVIWAFLGELGHVGEDQPEQRLAGLSAADFRRAGGRPSELPKLRFVIDCVGTFENWIGPAVAGDLTLLRFVAAAIEPTGLRRPATRASSSRSSVERGVKPLVEAALRARTATFRKDD